MATPERIHTIETNRAGRPQGHYSQAVIHNGFIYISGQLGIAPGQDDYKPGSVADQSRQCLMNIAAILDAAGSDLSRLLKVSVFISELSHWEAVDSAFSEILGENKPARSVVPCKDLYFGFGVEMEAIAAL